MESVAVGVDRLAALIAAFLFFVFRRNLPSSSQPIVPASATKIIAPRPVDPGQLDFKDDFDATSPQPIFPAGLLNFENVDGAGQLTTPHRDVLRVFYADHHLKNFIAECEFEIDSDRGGKGCGFFFRGDVRGLLVHEDYVLLVLPKERNVIVGCYRNPTYTQWNEYPCDDAVTFAKTNQLRLEVAGREFRVFINGLLACRCEDASIAHEGIIGLCAYSTREVDYSVLFRKLRVYRLNAPEIPPTVVREVVTPQAAAQGSLLFHDDFDTPAPLPSFPPASGTLVNEHGKGVFTAKSAGILGGNYQNCKLKDFIAEFEIEGKTPLPAQGYGLFFRGRWGVGHSLPIYHLLLVYPVEEKVCLGYFQAPTWTYWSEKPCKPGQFFRDRPNRVRLEVKEGQFRVFINGSFACELVDARSRELGLIGLGTCAEGHGRYQVTYSKLRVYQYPAEGKNQ